MTMTLPNTTLEMQIGGIVAGVDEVGRGCWAGPVMAVAVILPPRYALAGVNDSKKLSMQRREVLHAQLIQDTTYAIGQASVAEIDRINILQASLLAMRRALLALPVQPDAALIDGNRRPEALPFPSYTVVKGDSVSSSIAAASIIAKVTRDRLMAAMAKEHPFYGWERNAGYGTKLHQQGLAERGVTAHHRRSFRPIRAYMAEHESCDV